MEKEEEEVKIPTPIPTLPCFAPGDLAGAAVKCVVAPTKEASVAQRNNNLQFPSVGQ